MEPIPMHNLVKLDLTDARQTTSKNIVQNKFVDFFVNADIISTKKVGGVIKTTKIEKNIDPLKFKGYFVSRKDLIQILSGICQDIKVPENITKETPLSVILDKMLKDTKVIGSNKSKIGVGIRFGLGTSDQIRDTPASQELQLVIDALGKKNGSPVQIIDCYTTANIQGAGHDITPPHGGTPYPNS